MKTLILIVLVLIPSLIKVDTPIFHKTVETIEQRIVKLAKANGYKVSSRIVNAIVDASKLYKIDALQLTAIGILETGLGKYSRTMKNKNGTHDHGLFQINTVNLPKCIAYRLDTPEGSALCAAKLMSQIKMNKPSDLGKYHSKTPSKKLAYFSKLTKVLSIVSR